MARGGTPAGMDPNRGGQQRLIDDRDIDGWMEAASHREPPRTRDRNSLREYLQARDRRKWNRLQKSLRWAEDELLKLGMNPEDARWVV